MANQRSKPRFNPRGGDRRGQRQISARPSSSLWYGLALLLVLGLMQMFYLMPGGRTIPYSEFKSLVKAGQVAGVVISDQVIRGSLKDGPDKQRLFTVARVEDPKLTEELEARGVKYTGESTNRWLPDLLLYIVPFLFLIGLWSFFFRRMGGAE